MLCFPQDTTVTALIASSNAKWILFAPHGPHIQQLWQNVLALPKDSRLVGASVLESHFSSSETSKSGTILVYCNTDNLRTFGEFLIRRLHYTSKFAHLDCESHQNHRLLRLHAPLSQRLNYHQDQPTQNMIFRITSAKALALHLGAQWDNHTQKWYAPNRNVWNKLIVYYEQEPEPQMDWEPVMLEPSSIFTVFSLNVCHEQAHMDERMLGLFAHIQSFLPDIVCLQEMTNSAAQTLVPLMQSLKYTTPSLLHHKVFGEMLFVRSSTLKIHHFEQMPLRPVSSMNRELHLARVTCLRTGKSFHCATCHLETGRKGQELRQEQLRWVTKTVPKPCVIAGDLNLSEYDVYVKDMLHANEFVDAWQVCGANFSDAHTWDARKNSNLVNSNYCSAPKKRFDRVLVSELQALEFNLKANEEIPLIGRHISDHFGVMCRFQNARSSTHCAMSE